MKRYGVFGAAALLCISFGTGIVAVGIGVRHLPPLTFTALRLCLVVIAFASLLTITGRRVPRDRRLLRNIALVGVLSVAVPHVLTAFALRLISSTLQSILSNLVPVFSVVLAHFIVEDEPLTWRTALGVLAAVVGASLVVWGGAEGVTTTGSIQALGVGVVLAAGMALSIALGSVFMRLLVRDEDSLVVTGGQMATSLILVAPVALLVDGVPELGGVAWQGWGALVWAALIGGILAYLSMFWMVSRWGVTSMSVGATGVALVTTTIGVSLLGETLTAPMVIGGLVLIGGVLIVLLGARGGR